MWVGAVERDERFGIDARCWDIERVANEMRTETYILRALVEASTVAAALRCGRLTRVGATDYRPELPDGVRAGSSAMGAPLSTGYSGAVTANVP